MNVIKFIKSKMFANRRALISDNAQDLLLYRQLRDAENKLHKTRESLQQRLALRNITGNEVRHPVSATEPGPIEEIECLRREVLQREADYQRAQLHVRAYFYSEACCGPAPESGLAAGQPAQ